MAGMFDDLIPTQPAAVAPGGGMFDDLIPQAAGQPAPLTIRGTPQNAGDALNVVEGTGSENYDTGAPEGGATIGDRVRNLGGMAVAGLDSMASAVPFTDRLAALAAAGTGLGGKFGDYSGNLAQLHAEEGAAKAAHPNAALAGELIGGTALPLPAVGWVGRGASAAAKVAAEAKALQTGVAVARDTTPLLVKAARGVAAGTAIGGLQGAGASQDLGDLRQTALSTGVGAGIGAAIGAGAPAIGAGAGAAYRRLMAPAVHEAPGVPAAAREMVADAIRRDGPDAVMAKLRQYGPDATLSDLGPSLQGIAMGQAVKDGPGVPVILDNLEARQRGTSDRILGDVGQALGPAQNADAVARQVAEVGQAASDPLFARAAAAGVPYSADLAQRPAVASALRDAATSAANRGQPLGSITLDATGNPVSSDAAIQAYEAGQRPALTEALARVTGSDPAMGPLATRDALTIQRSAAADPLYTAYRSMNVPMTPELQDMLSRPSVARAIPEAERKAADQGRTIFAKPSGPASSWERDPLGSGTVPEFPGDATIPRTAATPDNTYFDHFPKPTPPDVPRPQTARDVIRGLGGVRDSRGDLTAAGVDEMGPGIGKLLHPAGSGNGVSADEASQVLAQLGYFGADTSAAMANRSTSRLADALTIHPTYPEGPAAEAWAGHDADMRDWLRWKADTAGDTRYRDPAMPGRGPAPSYSPEDMGLPPGGQGQARAAPQLTPEGLDYVKRALGDRIDTAQRAGNRDDARIYTGLQQDLLRAIERHPDPAIADAYGAARRAYAGPSREMDALNAGRAALADAVTPEQMTREFGALHTDGERQRYRDGLFSAMRDKLGKASDTANFVNTIAGNQALRDKFATVAHSPEALDRFHSTLDTARQRFTEAQRPTSEAWHQALAALDARAVKGEPGIAEARDALAAHMMRDPDYARARGIQQDYAGLQDAITAGRTALRGGPTAIHPDDYAAAFQELTPAGQAAQRVGLADNVYRKLGDTRNDLTAINDVIKGPNDRSRSIIGTTFGQEAADRLSGAAEREAVFARTHDEILRNSVTARRTAMERAQADPEHRPFEIGPTRDLTATGALATLGKLPVNALLRALQSPVDNTARDLAVSRALTATGDERNRLLVQLLRAQNAADTTAAIGAPAERAGTALAAVSPGVLAALLRGRPQPTR